MIHTIFKEDANHLGDQICIEIKCKNLKSKRRIVKTWSS